MESYIDDLRTLDHEHGQLKAYPIHPVSRGDLVRDYGIETEDNPEHAEDMIGAALLERDRTQELQERRIARTQWAIERSTKLTLGLGGLLAAEGVTTGDLTLVGLGLASLIGPYADIRSGEEDLEDLEEGYTRVIADHEDRIDDDHPLPADHARATPGDVEDAAQTLLDYSDIDMDHSGAAIGAVLERRGYEDDHVPGIEELLDASYAAIEAEVGTKAAHTAAVDMALDEEYGVQDPYADTLRSMLE